MSVINNMLRDLDARRVDPGNDEALPEEVLAAPGGGKSLRKRPRPAVLIAPVLLAVIVLGSLYFWPHPAVRAPQPVMIAELTPAVAPAQVSDAALEVAAPVSPPQTVASATAPAAVRSETPSLTPSMAKAVSERSRADSAEGAPAPRESKFAPRPAAARAPELRTPDMPVTQALPVAAPTVAIVSPAANTVGNTASIRLEQSTQTQQERNLTEVQRAADLQRRGALVEAETTLRGVLDNDKSMLPARLALVSLLSRQQRSDEARKVLKDGVENAPTQAQLLLPYARLLAARGEWRPAYEVLVPAADVLAQDAEYRALCGAVLQRLGQFSQASAEYRAALRLAPTAGAWWVGLGLSLEGDGRPVEARNAYLQAKSSALSPDIAQFVDNKLARIGPADQSVQ